MNNYHGIPLQDSECQALTDLESKIGKPIPFIPGAWQDEFGFALKGKHVSQLRLRKLKLESFPESFCNFTSLKILDLSQNEFTVLPESFSSLSSLKVFDISQNILPVLPDSFCRLIKLEEIFIAGNKLTVLPDCFGNLLKLRILDAGGNDLTFLPDSICNLSVLQRLNLECNKLISLPNSLGNLNSLKNLLLMDNNLKTLPVSIGKLNLKVLTLFHMELESLPRELLNIKSLKYVSIDPEYEDNPVINELYNRNVKIQTDPYGEWYTR